MVSETPDNGEIAARAVNLRELGDELPLHTPTDDEARCSCGGRTDDHGVWHPCETPGKHPRIAGWNAPGYRTEPHMPAAWSRSWPERNVGLLPAPGILVVDIDNQAAFDAWVGDRPVPETLTTLTGRGQHMWLRVPPGRKLKAPPGADLRSRGTGQVVVPPSRHHSGSFYRWKDPSAEVAAAPQWLLEALTAMPRLSVVPDDPGDLPPALTDIIATPDPDRSSTIRRLALACAWHRYPLETLAAAVASSEWLSSKLRGRSDDYLGDHHRAALADVRAQFFDPTSLLPPPNVTSAPVSPEQPGGVPGLPPGLSEVERLELEASDVASSWDPIDLGPLLDGTAQPVLPTVGHRDDGPAIFYRGRVNSVYGGSEAGKSLLMVVVVAQELAAGNSIVYLDFEDTEDSMVERLEALGVAPEAIRKRFTYLRPEQSVTTIGQRTKLKRLLDKHKPSLVVIDGVTESMVIHSLELKDNSEVTKWLDMLPRRIARYGDDPAAVVMIDHVTHANESDPAADPIGGVLKRTGVDGVMLRVLNRQPFQIGGRGTSQLWVRKDRIGRVRAEGQRNDKTNLILFANFTVDSTSGAMRVYLDSPEPVNLLAPEEVEEDEHRERARIRSEVMRVLDDDLYRESGMSQNALRDLLRVNKNILGEVLAQMVDRRVITKSPHKITQAVQTRIEG